MKTLVSALIALSFFATIAAPASAAGGSDFRSQDAGLSSPL
jgi:hypothetical protein